MTGDVARDLPDFVVIGAQKAGTTSLWHYLRSHADVFMPDIKEVNFFATEGTWNKGEAWYRSLFSPRRPGQVAGEASPGYTMFPIFSGAAERMAKVVPDVKLVYLIREPVSRMVSSWYQSRADGLEHRSLRESVLLDIRYVSLSQYATQLERYLDHFDRAQILIARAEDLDERAAVTMKEICSFIGVDPGGIAADLTQRHNPSAPKRVPRRRSLALKHVLHRAGRHDLAYRLVTRTGSLTHRSLGSAEVMLDDDVRRRLADYVRPDLERLRPIVGPDLDLWGYA